MRDGQNIKTARRLRRDQTDVEARLWSRLRNRAVAGAKFRRQHTIGPYVADFACMELSMVIELDGSQHGERLDHDRRREAFMARLGFKTLRFWNTELVEDFENVVDQIWAAVEERQTAALTRPAAPADLSRRRER